MGRCTSWAQWIQSVHNAQITLRRNFSTISTLTSWCTGKSPMSLCSSHVKPAWNHDVLFVANTCLRMRVDLMYGHAWNAFHFGLPAVSWNWQWFPPKTRAGKMVSVSILKKCWSLLDDFLFLVGVCHHRSLAFIICAILSFRVFKGSTLTCVQHSPFLIFFYTSTSGLSCV